MTNMPVHFAAPPRNVPLSLRIVNFFNGFAQIGWAVFGFGMIFFWAFAGNADLSFATFRGNIQRVKGRVTSVENTSASENHQQIQASHYDYNVGGEWFSGKSYSSGSAPAKGDDVTVEYVEGNPGKSRIEGMRRALFGPWVILVAIFPAVGFVILYFSSASGAKRNRLLREGILAQGTLVDKEPTNVTINNRPLWEFTFEFTDRNGQRREAKCRSTDTNRLQDEPTEALLYDPQSPERVYVLDEAPARPKFENGELTGRPVAAMLALILPGIIFLINATIAVFKLGLIKL